MRAQVVGAALGCIIAPLCFELFWQAFPIGQPGSLYSAPYANGECGSKCEVTTASGLLLVGRCHGRQPCQAAAKHRGTQPGCPSPLPLCTAVYRAMAINDMDGFSALPLSEPTHIMSLLLYRSVSRHGHHRRGRLLSTPRPLPPALRPLLPGEDLSAFCRLLPTSCCAVNKQRERSGLGLHLVPPALRLLLPGERLISPVAHCAACCCCNSDQSSRLAPCLPRGSPSRDSHGDHDSSDSWLHNPCRWRCA